MFVLENVKGLLLSHDPENFSTTHFLILISIQITRWIIRHSSKKNVTKRESRIKKTEGMVKNTNSKAKKIQ